MITKKIINETKYMVWSRDHRQIEVNIGLCKSLFNQSEAGILVGGMTKQIDNNKERKTSDSFAIEI